MLGNWLKTSILMAGIMALFGAIGSLIGGASGMIMALLFGGAMNIFAYWFSDSMVLKMYNAQEVDEASAPLLAELEEVKRRSRKPARTGRGSGTRGTGSGGVSTPLSNRGVRSTQNLEKKIAQNEGPAMVSKAKSGAKKREVR